MRRESAATPHSFKKRILFRFLAVCVALAPFVAVELVLRIWMPLPTRQSFGGVDDDPLVDLHQLRPLFEPSPDRTEMQIGPQRSNFFQPASFQQTKPENGRRIFVLGGSTVQGRPYATETAFPKLLEIELSTAFPDIDWEVVNCGGVSYASYRLDVIAAEVLRYAPDGLVVYTGHNEFLEDRTYAGFHAIPRPLARGYAFAARSELVRRLAWIVRPSDDQERAGTAALIPEEVDARLDHAGGLQDYQRNLDHHRSVVRHFELTLRRIADRCHRANVPLLLCVPASDIVETPPFKSTLPADTTPAMQSLWQRMHDPDQSPEVRLRMAEQILVTDPENAAANYLLGRAAWEQEDYENAAAYLLKARDFDVCPLRATSTMEQIVRNVVREAPKDQVIRLLDVPQLFASEASNDVCQPALFVDHVHPQIHGGHTRIAAELFTQLSSIGPLGLTSSKASSEDRTAAVNAYLGGINEAYYHRGKQRIEGLRMWAKGRAGGDGSDR
ncbi:hypothetical protein FF011L_25430 [Roseimaritima multifibrata]|uniref:GDSL-like Lipase/Acylhydrolase n=1 Tax=Roseimaritima multifibrata TaxID=1930274 RepID=A0A517MFV9_9BACT|nr:hypothetical protein [Roseimaritima multifibrata]QDS93770.1 hypothetical protein FF011L_25430 [Roseimaritima multifibrata]